MANKASKYTKIRAEKRLQAVASLVREDLYFNSEYSRVKNIILPLDEERARQIDLYVNEVLKGSWFLQYWYRWYFGIQADEGERYLGLTLQNLMEGGLKYKTMWPGQRTIFDKIEAGHVRPFLQFAGTYTNNLIVLVMKAFSQTRVYPETWYQAIEDSYRGMVRWLSRNKSKDSPRIKPIEGGHEITLDETTVNAQTLRNAMHEYDNTYWWQFSKKSELRAKYPFNVQKFSRAWDYHWVKDARNHCRDVLKGKQTGIRLIELSENFIINQDAKDAIIIPHIAMAAKGYPQTALVPHLSAHLPNHSGTLEIPEQEREYSVRARSACEVLGITVRATKQQVKFAYRKMALMYHPDKFTSEDPSEVIRARYQFNRIQAAYEFLFTQNGLNDFIRKGKVDLGFLYRDMVCQREEWADMRKEMEEYLPVRDAYIEARLEAIKRDLKIDREGFEEIRRDQQINREDFEEIRRDQQLLREDLDRQEIEIAKLCAQRDRLMMLVAEKRKLEDINSASTRTLLTPDYSARVSPPPAQATVSKEIDPLRAQPAISSPVAK